MYSFKNDYSEGAHPRILEALMKTNGQQEDGYGMDIYCQEAQQLLRKRMEIVDADIHFVSGGTQANIIVIGGLLQPHQAVIAATTGHIAVHEAGAIEATGHKVLTVETTDGKLTVSDVTHVCATHTDEHMVQPKMVFISNSTEVGTIYTKEEVIALSQYCRAQGLLLYMDGARLGSALTAPANDLTLADIARLVDIFYIGGTKNGLLLGEAIVVTNVAHQKYFRWHIKQRGGLLAKGRVLGVQFAEVFRDGLFEECGAHANAMATLLAQGFLDKGYEFLTPPASNQIFPILPNETIARLQQTTGFYVWQPIGETHAAIRLVTSWATTREAVETLVQQL